jgi:uncharacterized protein (DUF58 family)
VSSRADGRVATLLAPSRDERLVPYCLIAFGALIATLATGEPALAALAAPFVLALAVGLRRVGPVEVRARVALDADQVLEGDLVAARLELEWDEALEAEVMLHRLKGVAPTTPDVTLSWSLPAGTRSAELPIQLQATQWGRHTVGEVWLRLRAPFGLLSWTGRVAAGPTLRVLPGNERLNRLLDPAESRAVLGAHRSRRFGDGHDFAELRPYTPGDRLRDLNWRATARHRLPFVNRHHPERSGDVVIVIDAFVDGSGGSSEALARAARAAWALASVHLQANDRVGIAGLGDRTRWLPPAGGRRAKYRILETLLGIGGEAADPSRAQAAQARAAVPPAALVVALTPLHSPRTIRTLQAWRARGRSVAVAMIDTSPLLGEPASTAEALARRLWRIELDRHVRELTEVGIAVVTVADDGAISPVVAALRRARKAPAAARIVR